jgi:hypothetical protein
MQYRIQRAVALLSLAFAVGACSDAPTAPKAATPSTPAVAAAKHTLGSTFTNIPVTGTVANGGTFTGTATITQFVVQNGQLMAVGTVSGTLTDALGNVIGTVSNIAFSAPVTAQGTCTILTLDIGAIHLTLLGLNVDLAPIHLSITASSGPGNLLGNLLCGIANLLNGGLNLGGLATLLNQLLALLG